MTSVARPGTYSTRVGLLAAGILAVGAGFALIGSAPALAAPPASDANGFVDSTARCAAPATAVAFGYTETSRVAICRDASTGQFQYRGVRVTDGARLILAATPSGQGYRAENDGVVYTVTSSALTVTAGSQSVRSEPMLGFNGASTGVASTPVTPRSTQPSAAPEPVTPSTPLPPPLPAEVGHR